MRHLEKIVWWAFLIWAFIGIIILFLGKIKLPETLVWADALFLFLAALNLFLITAKTEGFRITTISFLTITLGAGLVEMCGALTGWPFGQYYYTENLGWRIENILPLAIPLAWWIVIGLGQAFGRICFPMLGRLGIALFCGLWAVLFDLVLEPFAWKVKQYWIWQSHHVPWNNYLAWFSTAFLLCLICPAQKEPHPEIRMKLTLIASLIGLIFWVGNLKIT